ncbi:MAG: exo-beta-N-acetylmuramidase NamZ domain-containing protein, partial [Bacteroidales bacterium]
MRSINFLIVVFLAFVSVSGFSQNLFKSKTKSSKVKNIIPGAYLTTEYLPLLEGKKIAVVANKTSMVNNTHLVDTLVSLGFDVVKIFGPEHGFRSDQPDGKEIDNTIDPKTGIEIISLYGNHRKPTQMDLENVD